MRSVCSVCQCCLLFHATVFSPKKCSTFFSSMYFDASSTLCESEGRLRSIDVNLSVVLGRARERMLLLSSSTNGPLR